MIHTTQDRSPPRQALLAALLDPARPLLHDTQRAWSGAELVRAACRLRSLLTGAGGPLGIACAGPGWLLASLVAAWGSGRDPVLLDPGLKQEMEALCRLQPGIQILTDGPVGEGDGRISVRACPGTSRSSPGFESPGWQGARRAHTRRYVTDEQRSQPGGHPAQPEAVLGRGGQNDRVVPGQALGEELTGPGEDPPPAADSPPDWLTLPASGEIIASFFTSGSEGAHKVVDKTGRQIYGQADVLFRYLQLAPGCRVLSFVPPYHLLGFFYGLVLPLAAGGETMVADRLTGPAMQALLAERAPDIVVGTATHYRFLVRGPGAGRPSGSTRFLSSGAPLDPAVAEAFAARFGAPVMEIYGATETGGVACRVWPEPYRPMPGVSWQVDPESLRLRVRSPWASPHGQETWVDTDDAAEAAGAEGFQLLGRVGHMVKVGAKRFSSVEVEQALRAMPGVLDAAAVPYERFGEQALAAFISVEPGRSITEEQVRAFLAGRLAAFKLPRTVRFLAELPRARLAKLDYANLRALALAGDAEES